MSYQITHNKDDNYLEVHYSGSDSLAERIRLKEDIEKRCAESNVIHILIDTRDSHRYMDQDDFSNYVKLFEFNDFYCIITLAVVVTKIDMLNKGVKAAMKSMGIKKKLFTDKNEAIDWLLQ